MHQRRNPLRMLGIGDAFNDKGELIKEPMHKLLKQYLEAFAAFVEKQSK